MFILIELILRIFQAFQSIVFKEYFRLALPLGFKQSSFQFYFIFVFLDYNRNIIKSSFEGTSALNISFVLTKTTRVFIKCNKGTYDFFYKNQQVLFEPEMFLFYKSVFEKLVLPLTPKCCFKFIFRHVLLNYKILSF